METRSLFGSTGRRIKILRDDLGLSQEALAEKVSGEGVYLAQSTLSRFEQDKSPPPSDVLAVLARVLGVSSDYLVMLSDDPSQHTEASNPRMLSLLEEASTAYGVDREVERLLRVWSQLDVEDRRLLLAFVERLYAARPRVVGE